MDWLDLFLKAFNSAASNPINKGEGAIAGIKQGLLPSILETGAQDPLALEGTIARGGYNLTAEQEKWLDNLISRQNTEEARSWEEQMRDTQYLSAGNQLEQLGLSSSGVLQTGGASYNAVGAADNVSTNIAQQKYAQRMSLAKSILGMTSSMAAAGIYGKALGTAKHAANIVTSAASHSALGALTATGRMVSAETMSPRRAELLRLLRGEE